LSHEEFPLLEIEQTDMGEILEVLGTASTSPNLSASGFDMNFSALELIETLEHLCISHCNLSVAAKADILPTLVSLLVNGQIPEMKAACRLLWILLGDPNFCFNKDVYALALNEILRMLLENNDKGLQLLSQLLLNEPEINTDGKNTCKV